MEEKRPAVVFWFKLYAALSALCYLAAMLGGIALLFVDPSQYQSEMHADEATLRLKVYGVVLILMSLPFSILHSIPLFLKRSPGVWMFDMVVIALGVAGCCMPINLALLIFWVKPETKVYFGKND